MRVAIDDNRKEMAAAGARALLSTEAGNIAEETQRMQLSGETTLLAGLIKNVSQSITRAMLMALDFTGTTGEPELVMNTDLIDQSFDPSVLSTLIGLAQSGALPLRVVYEYIIEKGVTTLSIEEIQEQLAEEAARFVNDLPDDTDADIASNEAPEASEEGEETSVTDAAEGG